MNYPNYGAPQQPQGYPPNPYQQPQPPAQYPPQPPVPGYSQAPAAPPAYGQQPPQQGQFFGNQPQQPTAPPVQNGQPPQGWTPDQQSAPEPQDGGDTSSFFGGAPSLSFAVKNGYVLGTYRGGFVTGKTKTQQTDPATKALKTFPDGNPRMQLVLTVKTTERADPNDDGERRLYVGGSMVKAVGAALKQANLSDITGGCWIYVARTGDKPPSAPGLNGEGIYTAVVAGPGQPDPGPGLQQHQPQPAAPAAAPPWQDPAQQWQGPAGQAAVAATGMDPRYATPAMQQAAYAAVQQPPQQPQGPGQPVWDGQQWQMPPAPSQPPAPPQPQFDPNQWSSPVQQPQPPQGQPGPAYQPPAGYPQQPQQPPGWTPFQG